MKRILPILAFFISYSLLAQYTEVINSKRPGYSQSPYSVGTNVYQAEGGLLYEKAIDSSAFNKAMGSDIFLRAGVLSERLEFNLDLQVQKDFWYDYDILTDTKSDYNHFGFSKMTLGAKYLIYMPKYKDPSKEIRSWKRKTAFDWNRLIPAVGIYAGLNTNLLSEPHKMPQLSPKASILLQNDFSDYFIWVNNITGDHLTINEYRNFGYISTLIISLTDRFSLYGENQGTFYKHFNEFKLGGGMAYLLSPDLQIDLNLHRNFNGNYSYMHGGLGVSWRYDNHIDKEINQRPKKDGSGKIRPKRKFRLFGKRH